MYCKQCGREVNEGEKFCVYCGAAIEGVGPSNGETEETVLLTEPQKAAGAFAPESEIFTAHTMTEAELLAPKKHGHKKVIIIVGVLLAVAVAALIAGLLLYNNKRDRYNEQISLGDKYLAELDYDNAEASYLAAIKIDAKNPKPYIQLADVYVAKKQYEKAEDILKKGLENVTKEEDRSVIRKKQTETLEKIEQAKKEDEEKKRQEEIKSRYTWVVEPTIEADDINYAKISNCSDIWVNEFQQQAMWEIAVAKKENSYALINMEGELLTEYAYKSVEMWDIYFDDPDQNVYVMYRNTPVYENVYHQNWNLYEYKKTGLEPTDGLGGPITLKGEVVYQAYGGNIVLWDSLDESPEYPDHPVGARVYYDDGWDKYVLVKDQQLVNNKEYDEIGAFACGVIPVCEDGKWGYLDEEGKEVIPIQYDASWPGVYSYYGEDGEITLDLAYTASENTIVLCKDEKWRLVDTTGSEILPEGEFEAIRPVYDGKCWVKKDGKWGVIQLTDKVLDSMPAQLTSTPAPKPTATPAPKQAATPEPKPTSSTMPEPTESSAPSAGGYGLYVDFLNHIEQQYSNETLGYGVGVAFKDMNGDGLLEMIVGGYSKWQFMDAYSCADGTLISLFELDHGGVMFRDADNPNIFFIRYSQGTGLYVYDRVVAQGEQFSVDDWYASSETGYTPEPIYTIGDSQIIQEEWDAWEGKIEQNPVSFSGRVEDITWTEQVILDMAQ